MEISGNSGVAQALQVKSLQMAKGMQEQEGAAAMQLLESADVMPKPSPNGASGTIINTTA